MGTMAAIVGAIGGLCAVLGIITITEVMPPTGRRNSPGRSGSSLSAILLLASIALAVGRGSHD